MDDDHIRYWFRQLEESYFELRRRLEFIANERMLQANAFRSLQEREGWLLQELQKEKQERYETEEKLLRAQTQNQTQNQNPSKLTHKNLIMNGKSFEFGLVFQPDYSPFSSESEGTESKSHSSV